MTHPAPLPPSSPPSSPRAAEYLAAYTAQLRARVPAEQARWWTRVGPVLRNEGASGHGLITYRDLGGLDGAALDAFIAAQRDHFAALGRAVEWKLHGGDLPSDLPERLSAAGFVPTEVETVLVGAVEDLAAEPAPPPGVRLREVTERADLDRLQRFQQRIWNAELPGLADSLEREVRADGDRCVVVLAETATGGENRGESGGAGEIVCAAWVRLLSGTDFATMWGGSTLPEWRGKGVYRATVAHRARVAARGGLRLAQVDASADSLPILTRLGLLPVATTAPYEWTPKPGGGPAGAEPA